MGVGFFLIYGYDAHPAPRHVQRVALEIDFLNRCFLWITLANCGKLKT